MATIKPVLTYSRERLCLWMVHGRQQVHLFFASKCPYADSSKTGSRVGLTTATVYVYHISQQSTYSVRKIIKSALVQGNA